VTSDAASVLRLDRHGLTQLLGPLQDILDRNIVVGVLKSVPLLSHLPEGDLQRLAGACACDQFERGAVVLRRGAPVDCLYILREGCAAVSYGTRCLHQGVGCGGAWRVALLASQKTRPWLSNRLLRSCMSLPALRAAASPSHLLLFTHPSLPASPTQVTSASSGEALCAFEPGDYFGLEQMLAGGGAPCTRSVVVTTPKATCYVLSRSRLLAVVGSVKALLAASAAAAAAGASATATATATAPAAAPLPAAAPVSAPATPVAPVAAPNPVAAQGATETASAAATPAAAVPPIRFSAGKRGSGTGSGPNPLLRLALGADSPMPHAAGPSGAAAGAGLGAGAGAAGTSSQRAREMLMLHTPRDRTGTAGSGGGFGSFGSGRRGSGGGGFDAGSPTAAHSGAEGLASASSSTAGSASAGRSAHHQHSGSGFHAEGRSALLSPLSAGGSGAATGAGTMPAAARRGSGGSGSDSGRCDGGVASAASALASLSLSQHGRIASAGSTGPPLTPVSKQLAAGTASEKSAAAAGASGPSSGALSHLQSVAQPLDTSVRLEDLERCITVGVGTFGRVYMVRHVHTGALYALKELKKSTVVKLNQSRNVVYERAVMAAVRHPFLLRLVNTYQSPSKLYMLTEYVHGGELFNLLGDMETLPSDHARFYAACTLAGLAHLHSLGIVYRDLKVRAWLAGERGTLQGGAARMHSSGMHATRVRSAQRLLATATFSSRRRVRSLIPPSLISSLPCSPRTCCSTGKATSASWTSAFASTWGQATARTPSAARQPTLRMRWSRARATRTAWTSELHIPGRRKAAVQ